MKVRFLSPSSGYFHDCADFLVCVIDMFQKLRSADLPAEHVFTVAVGPSTKPTLAGWCLPEPEDVINVLAQLGEYKEDDGVYQVDDEGSSNV